MRKILFVCVLFLFSIQVSLAQVQAAKADFWVERIPVVLPNAHNCGKQQVTMIVGEDKFGILSSTDTLALQREQGMNKLIYRNILTDDLYTLMLVRTFDKKSPGFLIFITPVVKDAPLATHAIVISSTNICHARNFGKSH